MECDSKLKNEALAGSLLVSTMDGSSISGGVFAARNIRIEKLYFIALFKRTFNILDQNNCFG